MQAGILAVGRGNKVVEPVIGADGKSSPQIILCFAFRYSMPLSYKGFIHVLTFNAGIERPAVVTKMNLTLSADHRVFDGKVGGMHWF